jgi:hypothetical protein
MTKDLQNLAEKFMSDQVAIMKRHGNEPKVDDARYEETVRSAQRVFKNLSNACTRSNVASSKEKSLV